ncbi:InlB B-repeat-containing protein [Eubacterium sp. BL-380-WT-2B]|uniref:InlB B-repeat-containing protein n=1 Tax=Eubacterium TaxID=1730 RepID=UPI0012B3D059|nr:MULTISPECIES: InlB B-repeat-containing protein [Eubacterium]MSS94784.1 InlB B-repeat-containing protein [Eubacterium sp. BL-380-WT-2B]
MMKKTNDTKLYKIYISLLMMVVMIFPIFLSTAVQAEIVAPENPIQVITAFNVSDEDLKSRNIALGTKTEQLGLPDSVLVDLEESDEMPERGVEVPLTWTSQPQYDKDTPGEYTFTASAGEEYVLADGLAAPSIKVVVEKEADNQERLLRQAQPLSNAEPYQISSAGSALDQTKYTTLKAAFDAINLDTAAQYTISLSSNDDMTGDGAAELTRANVKIILNGNGHTILQGDNAKHIKSTNNIDLEMINIKLTASDNTYGGIEANGKVSIKDSRWSNMSSGLLSVTASFTNSTFQNITGQMIYRPQSSAFTDCTFKDMSSDNFMFIYSSGSTLFKNCILENVGYLHHDRSSPLTIEDCTFKNTGRIFTWNNCTLILKGTVLLDGTPIEMRNNAILTVEPGSDLTIKNTTTSAIYGDKLSNINFSGASVKFENNGRNIRSRKPTSEEIAQYPNISAVRTSIVEKYYNYLHPLNNKDIAFTGGIDFPSYIPTYDPNEGSGTRYEDRDTREPDYKNVFYGTGAGYIVLDNTSDTHLKYSRVGYEFVSWNTKSDGTGHSYTAYDVATIDADNNTFYAFWKAHQYTIKFDGNTADGGSTDDQTMTYDTAANLTANGYTKTGYTFTGWNTQPDGTGTAYSNGQNVKNLTTADGDMITLYAQWRANNYTIKYDGNAADSGSMNDQPMVFDVAANLTDNAYARIGYTFTGWNTQPDGTGTAYSDGQNVKNLTAADGDTITLFAQWRANSYTIQFDGNTADGGDTASQSMTYDAAANLTVNGYTKTGYTFTGWNTQSDGSGTVYTDGQNVVNLTAVEGEKVTLYAQWRANNYTIRFDGNTADGGSTSDQAMTYDQAANLTANGYTKTGYSFKGWNTQSDGGGTAYTDGQNVVNLTAVEGEKVTLYAQWRANNYTIRFDGNTADGGSTSDQAMTYDQAANLTANGYTKTGYSFKGWNTQSDGGGTVYTDGQNVVNLTAVEGEKVTLYAQWRANNYTIRFDGNTADGGDMADQSMTYDQAANLTANGYTKTGYTFTGWNTQSDGGGTAYTEGQNVVNLTSVEGERVTLYAQWRANSYTIQFDGNTADGGDTADQSMTYDQAADLTANGYTKTGYTFTGWNTQSDGGGTAYTEGQNVVNLTSVEGERVTLYAQWRANSYTIQFDGNTADGGNTPAQTMTYDAAANLTVNGYTKTGYTFAGWNTQSDGGGTAYSDGQNVVNLTAVEGEKVTLYAQWRANNYTIRFDGNTAAGGNTPDQSMTYDTAVNLTANGYTKTGYTFTGWNTQLDGGGTAYTDGQLVSNLTSEKEGSVTLYAQWRANNYTIQFDGNTADGGDTVDQSMTYDQAANLTANGYTKTGYTFIGWNTQPDGGGMAYDDGQSVINLTPNDGETVTLYAQWRANSYTIQFDGNTADGGNTPAQTMTYDAAANLTVNGYTKTGYTFAGWNTQSDGGGTAYSDGQNVVNLTAVEGEKVTLYAQWRANNYTIRFDGNTAEGGDTADQSMTYDQAANLTANGYTKTGYTFTGWNTQSDGGGTAYTDGQNVINLTSVEGETVTLFAQWRTNSYTIHFDGNTADGGDTASQVMTYNQAADLTANGYTKTGYTFTGWNTQPDGGGTSYIDGQNVTNLTSVDGETFTLFAQWRANSYTIQFDGNTADGGSTPEQTMTYDQAASLTANGYTKTGYTFSGWNTQPDGGGTTYTDGQNVTNLTSKEGDKVTLFAQWRANSYTIQFDGNTADGGDTASQSMTYDTAVNLTANGYTKTGYTFTGWNTQSDGGGTAYTEGQNVVNLTSVEGERVTLYAQWRANSYTIHFDGNTADGGDTASQSMTYDTAVNLTANGYTKTGYTFTGWNTQPDGGGTSYTDGQNVTNLMSVEGGTVTLYAQWRANNYTIHFDGNTADGGSTPEQAMTYDQAASLTPNGYTKTGYTFMNWNTQRDGGGTAYTDGQNVSNLSSKEGDSVTLYAQWRANSYTIQYDGNNADGGDMANQSMTYDQAANLTANSYAKTGYTFAGWNTRPDGAGTAYGNEQSVVNLTPDDGSIITLYAQWHANNYKVAFDGNTADSGSMSDQPMAFDIEVNLTANAYTKTGYTFVGWNTEKGGEGTAYTDGQTVVNLTAVEGETVTLYAQWRANKYIIHFDGNTADGGSTTEQAMTYDTAATLTANGYTKTGYTFIGWNTQPDGGGMAYDDGQSVINLTPNDGETVTLYAQWHANSYTIQFDGNTADSGSMTDQSMTYDQAASLTANGYIKTGYAFVGWNTQPDGGGTAYTDGQTVSNLTSEEGGTVTLFAQWRANNYTIHFDGNTADGGSTPEQAMTYDQAASLTTNGYTKTGYTFMNWNTQRDGGGTAYTDGQNVSNLSSEEGDSVTLYAQWRANRYTVQFDGNTADGGSTPEQAMTYDQAASLTINGYTKTGYTFTGWNTQPDGGGTSYTDGQNVTNLTSVEGGTVTLYAQWRVNTYSIQYDGNTADGGSTPGQAMTYDQAASLTVNGYTKTGYTFTGWNTQPDGTGAAFNDEQTVINLSPRDEDIVILYAQWRANHYTIQFDGNTAESGSTPDQIMTYDQTAELTANGYTKTGFAFSGWNTQADGQGTGYTERESVKNLTTVDDDTVLLYAQWRLRIPGITVNQNVSAHGDTINVTGTDFEPNAEITFTVHSTPREVGRVHADSNGEALFTFQMPFDIEAGDHTLLADNGIHSAQTPVKVTASAHADSNAADNSGHTGGNSAGTGIQGTTYIPIIMILLLCGVLVVVLLKRKHSKR